MSNTRYEVLGQIAEGGLGSVYKAYDRNLRREVALKRVRAATPEETERQAEALMEEARNLSTLQHPHVVTIYDVGRDDEGAYIIMELLKGETLENIIERGALAEGDFRELVSQSLEGLVAAHSNGLIHLDIKPQNFMVIWLPSGKFQIKILDFGLAKIAHVPTVQDTDEEGAVMGSIFFMAPEQFERSPVDSRTDLYSLGCVYYYALTQQYPFQGETGPEVMASHMYHSYVPLAQLRPDLPPFIHQWVEWLMNRLPDHRPSDAAQAYEIFQAGGFPDAATGEVQLGVIEAQPVYEEGAVTGPLRPAGPRAARPAVHRPGGQSQPLSQRPAPRPVARPVNIAAAMAPKHLTHRRTMSRGAVFGIIGAIAALLVAVIGFQQFRQSRRTARLNQLTQESSPHGIIDDVPWLLDDLDDPQTSDAAGKILGTLQDVESGNGLVAARIGTIKTALGKKNLAAVVAQRGLKDVTDPLLSLLDRTPEPDARIAIWNALAKLATSNDTDSLIAKMKGATGDELKAVEGAIVAASLAETNPERQGTEVLRAYGANTSTDEEQAMLLRALCRIGNKAALPKITEALTGAGKSELLRNSAAISLAAWPDATPVPALLQVLQNEKNEFIRINAVNSLESLAPLSGITPQGEIAHALSTAYAKAKSREQGEIIHAMERVIDPASVEFLRQIGAADPRRKAETEAAVKRIETSLAKAVTPADGATTLTADQAVLTPGPLVVNSGVIINWFGMDDRAGWIVKLDKPGTFDVQISQASDAASGGRFAVTLGSSSLTRAVDNTGSNTNFKTVSGGGATFAKPGIYRLWIRPVEIPRGTALMRLKEAIVTRTGG